MPILNASDIQVADEHRQRRNDALLRLPEGVSAKTRQFVAEQFDAGKDYSYAVIEAFQQGKAAATAGAAGANAITDEDRAAAAVTGMSIENYLKYKDKE